MSHRVEIVGAEVRYQRVDLCRAEENISHTGLRMELDFNGGGSG